MSIISDMTMLLTRNLTNDIAEKIRNKKILFLVGPRKSGKTQLIDDVLGKDYFDNKTCRKYNCDNHNVRKILENKSAVEIYQEIKQYAFVAFEEAQNLENLDAIIKAADMVYHDLISSNDNLRIVFTLSTLKRQKPKYLISMRGHYEIVYVMPLTFSDILESSEKTSSLFEKALRFGMYPEVYRSPSDHSQEILEEITNEYLLRDILLNNQINKVNPLRELLRQLALHIDDEISISKLSKYCRLDDRTIERYLDLLIESYVIFRHRPLNRRGHNEVKVRDKYYFWDLGIRNTILENHGETANRLDRNAMWTNFCIAERKKLLRARGERFSSFFWRTHDDQSIDYIEEESGWLIPHNFQWNDFYNFELPDTKKSTPSCFKKLYGINKMMHVTQDNLHDFLKS